MSYTKIMVIYFIFIRFLLLKKDYTQHGLGMLACFYDVVTYLDSKTMNVMPRARMMQKRKNSWVHFST